MPCSLSQPLICSGDQRIWRNFASILLRVGHREFAGLTSYRLPCVSLGFRLLEPIAALTTIAVNLPAHRALTDAQNFGDAFLARPTLAQRINLAAILILYSPVLAHRQPLAISRGYPMIASLNYALAT
jgi:hypothetical protein